MRNFLVILLALVSFSLKAQRNFHLDCAANDGNVSFSSAKGFYQDVPADKLIIPPYKANQTTTNRIATGEGEFASFNRYKNEMTVSLNSKINKNQSVVMASASYPLIDGLKVTVYFKGNKASRLIIEGCVIKLDQ